MDIKIPVYEPVLGAEERENVLRCLDTNWISSRGEFINVFEHEFAAYTGAAHAVSASNGTVALHLALLALDIGPGDEVIVPTFTYVASVNAIAYMGATPVFVDSLPDTWQIDPKDVERKITNRTKAIMPVHLYGQACDMEALADIANRHAVPLVEDCAEAFGSRIGNTHVGSWGAVSTYSFFGNKTITTGEGGMVVANDPAIDAKLRKLRGQGLAGTREYWHDVVGYNYRMTNICAAIGVAQLRRADELIAKKRAIASWYARGLKDSAVTVLGEKSGTTNSYWMNCIATRTGEERDQLRTFLRGEGIETRPAFYPAHTMPMYSQYGTEEYPVAVSLAARGINLPSSPALTEEAVGTVVQAIKKFFEI